MIRLFEKIGRFFVNLMIVGLILLVSAQIIMGNERFQNRLELAQNFINNYFNEPVEQATRVIQEEEVEREIEVNTGILRIRIISNASTPEIWLRQNGERVANFSDGEIFIEVNDDDLITIDSTHIDRKVWFEIIDVSPEITSFQTGQQFRISGGELENLGVIRMDDGRI